ncbi:MAG: type II secretion system F family protein [Lentisphaeria bacterium]|nr:type II secretion system F family protein [Lentisphaeria bacterium]
MPIFQYTAMDASGKEQKGQHEAASEEAVASFLKEQGMFPTSIKPLAKAAKAKKEKAKGPAAAKGLNINLGPIVMKGKDLTVFTRQLAILLDAGLPLIRSLKTLERQAKNPAVKTILGKVAYSVEGGSTFSEALAQHPKSFDKLYLNMIRAGEAAGKLELILTRLAGFREKAAKIAGKVKSAMVYPAIVLTIAIGITIFLMIFIVPKFEVMFTEMLDGAELPAITQFVMGVSRWLQNNIIIAIIIVAVLVVATKFILKTEKGRFYFDKGIYNAPVIGLLISRNAISKFSRTLGTLMGSGVPVLNALQIVRDTAGNELVSKAVQQVHDAVKEGEPMAPPLQATKIFPDMVISMIEVGEETGKLPDMLEKIADTYDEEVDNAVSALTSMIEPLMIVFLAVIVGGIVIALFSPLITIIQTLGGG